MHKILFSVLGCLVLQTGCQSVCSQCQNGPSTLFTWAEAEKPKNHNGKNDHDKNGNGEKENGQANGDDASGENKAPKSKRDEPLTTDRPDFTEASTTVGKGVIQFEGGYTYTRDRSAGLTTQSHSYPEALFRIGMFADWFEWRIGQNFASQSGPETAVERVQGAEDLYLGVKLALTEQKKCLPQMALILQSTMPTGHQEFSADRILPGFNFLFGWDVIEDRLTLGGSLQANLAVDDAKHAYLEASQSLTVGVPFTEKLGSFTEWFALYPSGAVAPDVAPEHYLNGGFYYRFTNNFQIDIRAGFGLNRHADDFFAGTGLAIRF